MNEISVLDNDTQSIIFEKAQWLKVKVNDNATAMSHPVEDGSKITDHIVFGLIEIELSAIVDLYDTTTYSDIKRYYKNRTIVTVQTKTDIYKNMVIIGIPHDEDSEMFSSVGIAIKFIEWDAKLPSTVKAKVKTVSKAKSKKQTPKKDTGKQKAEPVKDTKSIAASIADAVKGVFK